MAWIWRTGVFCAERQIDKKKIVMCHAQPLPRISFIALWISSFSWPSLILHHPLSSHPLESAATNLTPPTTPTTRMVPSILKQRKKSELLQDNLFTVGPEHDPFDAASLYSAPSLLSLHSTIEGGSSRHEEEKSGVRIYWDFSLVPKLPRNANMCRRESALFLYKHDIIEIELKQKGNVLCVVQPTMRSTLGVYDIQLLDILLCRYM